jgi:hypothetical protein
LAALFKAGTQRLLLLAASRNTSISHDTPDLLAGLWFSATLSHDLQIFLDETQAM